MTRINVVPPEELHDKHLRRGFGVKHDPAAAREDFLSVPADLFNDWTPTPRALRINRKRIAERLATMRQAR